MPKIVKVNKNDIYGSLTVIKETDKVNNKRRIKCLCKCGTVKIFSLSDLRSGHTKTCGCSKTLDLRSKVQIGDTFHRLTVIGEKDENKIRKMKCRCICNNITWVRVGDLISGSIKSCGCVRRERAKILAASNATRLYNNKGLYDIWAAMKQRCYNKNCDAYYNYGRRGIRICKTWYHDSNLFVEWCLNNGYKKGLELDRIDNNKGYKPSNCRFVTHTENNNNKRTNRILNIEGEEITIANAIRKYANNVSETTLRNRINSGWNINVAFGVSNSRGKTNNADRT